MPSLRHQALVLLFENRPELAVELLQRTVGTSIPDFGTVRSESPDLSLLLPTEYWADHVVTLVVDERPVLGVVVEVQLRIDEQKRYSWPVYAAALRARHRCPTCVLVVAPTERVARWARAGIPLGPPSGSVFKPVVIGPRDVPLVTDSEVARRAPELALLSVNVHGSGPRGLAVAVATLAGLHRAEAVTADRAMLYCDLVHAAVSDSVRRQLEEIMERGYEYQSDYAKKYLAQGRAEGEAAGRAEGEAAGRIAALRRILAARGLSLAQEQTARLDSCSDLDTLDRWIERAVVAVTATELFE